MPMLVLLLGSMLARADGYPAKPLKLIVPFAPGGGADAVARIVANRVSETIGQPIVIENRGGAGSIIGTEAVRRAAPDGYTLLFGVSGPISINPSLYKKLPYNPEKDFAPITMTTTYPYFLMVNAKLPVKSLKDFVDTVKAKPGEFSYGSPGIGSANHLVAELFASKAGLKLVHIPYRGTAPAVTDLLAGHVTMLFADPSSALPHIQAGTLRALGVTSSQRSSVAPSAPTIAESGYPGFEATSWHGVLARAGTPPAVIAKLHDQIVAALREPETRNFLQAQAMTPVGNTPEEFSVFIKRDIALWKDVAAHANISLND